MGWTLRLAVIDGDATEAARRSLGLEGADEEGQPRVVPLEDALGIELRDDFHAIGRLDGFTVVTAPWPIDLEGVWTELSAAGRVLVLHASENHASNAFVLYERGKRTLAREEGTGGPWKPRHRLEKAVKPGSAHPFAHQLALFEALTGRPLLSSEVMATPVVLHTRVQRVPAPDPAAAARVAAELDRVVAEPLPEPTGAWAGLQWLNRRSAILGCLDEAWLHDPAAALGWVPGVLAEVDRWPDAQRQLPHDRFQRIGEGEGHALDVALAPMFRTFRLNKQAGVRDRFAPKAYARFFAHPTAAALTTLDLATSGLPPEAVVHIAGAERLANLRTLSLDRTCAANEGVGAVARAPWFADLAQLDLYMCGWTDLGALAGATFERSLVALSLGGNALGAEALRWLAGGAFARVERLAIRHDPTVTEDAVRALLASGALPGLAVLDVFGAPIDAEAGARLAAMRPGLTVATEHTPGW